jgi:hypothetical protein
MQIVRCVSCDGYGWVEDDDGQGVDCDWCAGVGYVYRDDNGIDHPIPESDYPTVAEILERLEQERMRDLGYAGSSKHPREQEIRREDPDK